MSIACALRWEIASVGITLLGVAHPVREKHFKCGIYVNGAALIQDHKSVESRLVAFIILFVKIFEQTNFGMYL